MTPLEENIEKTIQDLVNDFLKSFLTAQETIRIVKQGSIKLKRFLHSKGKDYWNEELAYRMEKKIFVSYSSDKGLIL
jgi:hypothetical protein